MNSSESRALAPTPGPPMRPQSGEERESSRMAAVLAGFFQRLVELLRIPPPDTAHIMQRIETMELHIIVPIKAAGIVILLQWFYFTNWIGEASKTLEVPVEFTRYFLWLYIGINVVVAWLLLNLRRLRPGIVEGAVFGMSLVDGIFLGALTVVTGGYNSFLYWLFLGLIVRNSVSVPRAISQLVLNMTLSTCYILAGVIDLSIARNLDETERRVLELYTLDYPAEPLALRLVLLSLMTFGCYAVQVLLERQRQAAEEAREFAVREVQLHSAGRLAGEFAHQMKNPLAIINTAAYSLQRALRDDETGAAEQVEMIQEEIQRTDRIITQVMGYAQLSEGHVERLDFLEELDKAILQAFPPAARFPIQVHREYAPPFPPLLMQRRHASEIFLNVLQNAREALEGRPGNVFVRATCDQDNTIEVSIADDGSGIPPDKQEKIFEAYYTTKEKGTGLGLASVKHNVELYGGRIRVESALGKGARFTILLPAKTLMRLAKAK